MNFSHVIYLVFLFGLPTQISLFYLMSETKRQQRNSWRCIHCTFENTIASPLCGACDLPRNTIWKCEINNCNHINQNTSQCKKCLGWNSELAMEKSKWMRNTDDTWNCMKCTFLNRARDKTCSACQAGPNEMHLNELNNPMFFDEEIKVAVTPVPYLTSSFSIPPNQPTLRKCFAKDCIMYVLPDEVFCPDCIAVTKKKFNPPHERKVCLCGAITWDSLCFNCVQKNRVTAQ